ncbi:RidA family protein [Erythrobacter litoralis]|uniref:Putative endoribonuclease n=1 Tax=Erythrobacter litoralis (strain HTCC2594) TaxID=314225 RepID=Q2N901_ERYLH|nr:RidA family protein [Erythrobacter litoralis]ABC63840.1 putative endoribonuclease [Erythrobacter litoralis HTCC2594]
MNKKTHNPTPWLQGFGLNHAVEVSGATRTVYFSGQTSSAPDGSPLHPGDMVAQYKEAWKCLQDALAEAGMDASNLARLNFYVTDVPAFMSAAEEIMPIHGAAGAEIASTLLGVKELYHPDIMIEIEATAVA